MQIRQTGISVSELNRLIGEALRNEPRIRSVRVTAEISSFKHHLASGHWYFSLKDDASTISCVMFRQHNLRAALKPRDGDAVTVTGHVEIYPRDGKVQLYVTEMQAAGSGDLYQQFEMLRQKLAAEGLCDQGRKRVLPQIPRKVAVITSASGAALHDILKVSAFRCPWIPIVVVPSGVQGPQAAGELVEAVARAAAIPGVDVIILARGGGSMEDLWCFNDEALARAVAECPIPVVTGVGHETDTTIVDFVSDMRASTPSNAAEIVFPDKRELISRTELIRAELGRAMTGEMHRAQIRIHEARDRLMRLSPERRLNQLSERTGLYRHRLDQQILSVMRGKTEKIRTMKMALDYGINQRLLRLEGETGSVRTRMEAVSPLRVLERGYALVYDTDGRMLPGAESAQKADRMQLRFADGTVAVRREENDDETGNSGTDQL